MSQRPNTQIAEPPGRLVDRTMYIDEAAELYGTTVASLRRWISEGRIHGYRFGPRLIRVDVEDLEGLFVPIGTDEDLR